jgi:hypothetical protein
LEKISWEKEFVLDWMKAGTDKSAEARLREVHFPI